MEAMHRRVAGRDVHKATVVACARLMAGRTPKRECRTFATTTADRLALLAWLTARQVTPVAMEASGVYWKPVWTILGDGPVALILATAAPIKPVPGRKPDINDAMWIADLLACGLIQEPRALMRTRKQLVREQTRPVHRIAKTLEDAKPKPNKQRNRKRRMGGAERKASGFFVAVVMPF